ncbi:hypothetical protein M3Y99_00239700 [Aphelenchoides fujianensis]|nr:hypothetical protein M3Y99_00239700 [Aphelenchoides fujianensis]
MEAAVVNRKPRIRAAVRDGLNRFSLVGAMETDETNGAAQLVRLAAISHAHLESVRRSAVGIKYERMNGKWRLRLHLGLGTPRVVFPVDQAEMVEIIKLLAVPIYFRFDDSWREYIGVDWMELHQIGKYVNGLGVLHDLVKFPDVCLFIGSVLPRLKVVNSIWSVLERLPPLDLEKARIYGHCGDLSALNRHKILRLDVPVCEVQCSSELQRNQVISLSIKAVGILGIHGCADVPYDSIEAYCRRFPSLEDLHIVCEYWKDVRDLSAYFTALWAKCLEIRDRLHVAGLKRLFIMIKHNCSFYGTKTEWFEKLKQVEPFEEATSTIDHVNEFIRMFLKHNEPRGPKPIFILIKGHFCWSVQEDDKTDEGSTDSSGDELGDEGDDEAMEEDEDLDDSSEDAMDEGESTDEDGMDDSGGD